MKQLDAAARDLVEAVERVRSAARSLEDTMNELALGAAGRSFILAQAVNDSLRDVRDLNLGIDAGEIGCDQFLHEIGDTGALVELFESRTAVPA